MTHEEDLETRIRERGVRVEQRLEVLRLALGGSESGGAAELDRRREALLRAVRDAARAVREVLG